MKQIIIYTVAASVMLLSCSLTPPQFNEKKWHRGIAETSPKLLYAPHFRDGRYFNPWMSMEAKGLFNVLKWKMTRKREYSKKEQAYLPAVRKYTFQKLKSFTKNTDFILWIGHNTFLVRTQGRYFITDPIFSKRALLPGRKTPPALSAKEISEITGSSLTIIITHNHYDHLDETSIKDLPAGAKVICPLGLKEIIKEMNKSDITEMDWWQSVTLTGNIKITCLPAQHWSRRICQGVNKSLWASYMLEGPQQTIYFAGDSGYFAGYKEIGKKFKNIDYALIPTTAYHPRWFMHYAHMNIGEALMAFRDLKAHYFIPTQWGTFHLGDEPPGYPALDLKKQITASGYSPSRFYIPDIGELIELRGKKKNR